MTSKFALIFANTEYSDSGLAQLSAPGQDAKEFARVLESPDLANFNNVDVFINKDSSEIKPYIESFFLRQKKPDDLLLLYFSGHGVRDSYGSLYFAVRNTKLDLLQSTAIEADFIRSIMERSKSRRKILVLDCCNSGAFERGTKAQLALGSPMGINTLEGVGRVVLTASDATQYAWEGDSLIGDKLQNSIFTHYLIKGIEGDADKSGNGQISIDDLYDYTYLRVTEKTDFKQVPVKFTKDQQGSSILIRESSRMKELQGLQLPNDLILRLGGGTVSDRIYAITQLEILFSNSNKEIRDVVRVALEIAANDEYRRVAEAASATLSRVNILITSEVLQEKITHGRVEAEKKAREKEIAEQLARKKVEEEKKAREKEIAEQLARKKAEAEKKAREKEIAEQLAREKAEAEKKAREKVEAEQLVRKKAEADRLEREKQEKLARERQLAAVRNEAEVAQEHLNATLSLFAVPAIFVFSIIIFGDLLGFNNFQTDQTTVGLRFFFVLLALASVFWIRSLTKGSKAWLVGRREILGMIVGTIAFMFFSYLFNGTVFVVRSFSQVSFRPAVVIPIFLGYAFGPIVGFFSGAVGNLLGDALTGFGLSPQWSIGNGLIGFVSGCWMLFRDRKQSMNTVLYSSGALVVLTTLFYFLNPNLPNMLFFDVGNGVFGDANISLFAGISIVIGFALVLAVRYGFASNENVATALMWGMLGNILGLLFASLSDIFIYSLSLPATIVGLFLPAAGPNLIFAAILVPLLVGAYASVQRQSGR